jgi:flagellar assembly factor FliW
MQLDTTRFGMLEVAEDRVITFTQPIIGFQEFRRFVLLDGPESGELKWLQSTESRDLAFIIMDPKAVMPDYAVDLRPGDLSELAVSRPEDVDVYTLVVVPPDRTKVRTNLKAPVLINPKHRLAKQIILDRSSYPVQYFLSQAHRDAAPSQEVSNARSDAQGR